MAQTAHGDHWPQNPEAEAAVLGACLIDPDALSVVADTVRLLPNHFRSIANELVYATMLELRAANTPADIVTIPDALDFAGKLEDVGGTSYITALANNVPNSASAEHYAGIVKRRANQRRGLKLASDLNTASFAGDMEAVARVGREVTALLDDETPPSSRLHLMTDEEVEALPMPEMLVDGLLVRDTLAMIYGDTGTYKSFFAVDLALRIATGCDWYGHRTTRGLVVYVAAEGAPGMAKRVRAWKSRYQVSGPTGLYFLGQAIQLLDPHHVQAFLAAVATLPAAPVLVVIDTLGRSMNGGDENANSDIHRVIAAADTIRRATGATVLMCHHDGKDETRGARGGSALRDDLDTVIQFKRESETTIARCDKQKDYEPFAPFAFRLRRVQLDDTGEHSSGVIEFADVGTARAPLAGLLSTDMKALECLEVHAAGLTAGDWQRACEDLAAIARRTFYRSRDRLVELGYVERLADLFKSTGKSG